MSDALMVKVHIPIADYLEFVIHNWLRIVFKYVTVRNAQSNPNNPQNNTREPAN